MSCAGTQGPERSTWSTWALGAQRNPWTIAWVCIGNWVHSVGKQILRWALSDQNIFELESFIEVPWPRGANPGGKPGCDISVCVTCVRLCWHTQLCALPSAVSSYTRWLGTVWAVVRNVLQAQAGSSLVWKLKWGNTREMSRKCLGLAVLACIKFSFLHFFENYLI